MSLAPYQAYLYTHRCTIYRRVEQELSSGEVLAPTSSLVAADVACLFQTGDSYHGEQGDGWLLAESENFLTTDFVRVAVGTNVRAGDVMLQTTGPDAGVYYEVRGEERKRNRFLNTARIRLTRLELKPPWIP